MKSSGNIDLFEHVRIRFYKCNGEHLFQFWCNESAFCIAFDGPEEAVDLAGKLNQTVARWAKKKQKEKSDE